MYILFAYILIQVLIFQTYADTSITDNSDYRPDLFSNTIVDGEVNKLIKTNAFRNLISRNNSITTLWL